MEKKGKGKRPSFGQVVNAFHEKKVISNAITLKELAAVSDKLSSSLGEEELASWTFISPDYIYTGGDEFQQPEVLIRRSKA